MHMHFSASPKSVVLPIPICGYVGPDDEVCRDASLCTCPECLDWIRPAENPPTSANCESAKEPK